MFNDSYSSFATNLRNLRKNNNYTQEKLAKILDVSVTLIAMYENARRSPSIKMLNKISNYFNISIDELLGNSNKKTFSIDEAYIGISSKEFQDLTPQQRQSIKDLFNFFCLTYISLFSILSLNTYNYIISV